MKRLAIPLLAFAAAWLARAAAAPTISIALSPPNPSAGQSVQLERSPRAPGRTGSGTSATVSPRRPRRPSTRGTRPAITRSASRRQESRCRRRHRLAGRRSPALCRAPLRDLDRGRQPADGTRLPVARGRDLRPLRLVQLPRDYRGRHKPGGHRQAPPGEGRRPLLDFLERDDEPRVHDDRPGRHDRPGPGLPEGLARGMRRLGHPGASRSHDQRRPAHASGATATPTQSRVDADCRLDRPSGVDPDADADADATAIPR